MDSPEKLEYPNETWPAQDLRKCNVFLFAYKNSPQGSGQRFLAKAEHYYRIALKQFFGFETTNLTRPMALIMQNAFMFWACRRHKDALLADNSRTVAERRRFAPRVVGRLSGSLRHYSFAREIRYLSDRLRSRN